MRVLVLGGDGYIGWPTALHLSAAGHRVGVLDNVMRRMIDMELGTDSLVPIESIDKRISTWHELTDIWMGQYNIDVTHASDLAYAIRNFRPDAVVHCAEQRSAPYSMMGHRQARHTQQNNVIGTLNLIHVVAEINPDIHIVKLGTMGEYGTPNIDIEEGWLDIEHNGRKDRVLYPKRAGSWYHLSKVHDSNNLEFACRAWGLRVTDLNQGVVYGHCTDQTALAAPLATRFDYDSVFGTVLNRFCVQAALGMPLSVYGDGSQKRGFINLRDSVRCIELACLNPPQRGEFRVFNQMTESFSVMELAARVAKLAPRPVDIDTISNPRVEQSSHYYNVTHTALEKLGLQPHLLDDETINGMICVADRERHRVKVETMKPTIQWNPYRSPDC